jgi:hypothetical protein
MSKLASQSRITVSQFAMSKRWNALARAYRAVVSGCYAEDAGDEPGAPYSPSRDRLSAFERGVIKRYRALAPILGPVERAIIEGRGRYPRTLGELCAVRRALDEIESRWVEAG